jgi:hypothetical protein
VIQIPYGEYAGVAQSENVEMTDRDKEIINRLKDWDLWGPLVVCLALAVLLSLKAPVGQASLVFAAVFCAVWVGSAVVTINAQLLGGTISFFQSVCVLGYCVFPLTLASVVVDLFKWIPLGAFSTLVELAVLVVAFLWSTRASSVSLSFLNCD